LLLRFRVDLRKSNVGVLLGCRIEDWAEHATRPTPGGPEVDEGNSFAKHGVFEGFKRQIDGAHGVSRGVGVALRLRGASATATRQARRRLDAGNQRLQFTRRQLRLRMPTKHRVVERRHRSIFDHSKCVVSRSRVLVEL